jgi:hypothetical protein
MNARASENYLAISRSSSASKSVEIFWAEIYWGRLIFRAESSLIQSLFPLPWFAFLDKQELFPLPWFAFLDKQDLFPLPWFVFLDKQELFPLPWFVFLDRLLLI